MQMVESEGVVVGAGISCRCYGCGAAISLQEILAVDALIETSPAIDEIEGYFAHCDGDDCYFHDNPELEGFSLVNVCRACFSRF